MKDKIIIFVIGLLLGAVISTGSFFVYTTVSNSCNNSNQNMQMNGGQPPELPNGQQGENSGPPEMQNSNTNQNNNNNTQVSN